MVGLSVRYYVLQKLFGTTSLGMTMLNENISRNDDASVLEGSKTPRLRFNWTNLEPLSTLARNISFHQQYQCDLPLARFQFYNMHGLGSDLHIWSQAICNGMEHGFRIRTGFPWLWYDQSDCAIAARENDDNKGTTSVLTCYFPQSELLCPNDINVTIHQDMNKIDTKNRHRTFVPHSCPLLSNKYGLSEFRAATTEFLFTKVSPIVQNEAERQARLVFGATIPKNLITVQIRWGDKYTEMTLVPIEEYIDAVKSILLLRQSKTTATYADAEEVNIFLSTEDPRAVQEFRQFAGKNWNIFVDYYFQETNSMRQQQYNNNPKQANVTKGKTGLIALGSLLLAMEANDFVISTGSNWSRLINELRKNILNPRCQNCTRSIDLRSGEW
jgi:hypothetical protein